MKEDRYFFLLFLFYSFHLLLIWSVDEREREQGVRKKNQLTMWITNKKERKENKISWWMRKRIWVYKEYGTQWMNEWMNEWMGWEKRMRKEEDTEIDLWRKNQCWCSFGRDDDDDDDKLYELNLCLLSLFLDWVFTQHPKWNPCYPN